MNNSHQCFNLDESKIEEIIEKSRKAWLSADDYLHNECAESEDSIPVIYMDDEGIIGWREEGDESFWAERNLIFSFHFSEIMEEGIADAVREGIADYIDEQGILNFYVLSKIIKELTLTLILEWERRHYRRA